MAQIKISNEKQAFDYLEKVLHNQIGDESIEIVFDNWPLITLRLEGKGYDSTITSEMASSIVELQYAVNRTFARVVHNTSTARTLTADEKKDIQFKAKVEKGSSLVTIDLGDYVQKLGLAITDKMTPEMLAITLIGVSVAAGTTLAVRAFVKHRSEQIAADTEAKKLISLSQEETKRLEIFASAMTRVPLLKKANEDFDVARHEMVKSIGEATSVTINSVKLDNESAKAIASTPRATSTQIQANGNYYIREIKWLTDEVLLTLEDIGTKRSFKASFNDTSLKPTELAIIKEKEWSRGVVYLSINATELRGEITSATIISVVAQPDEPSLRSE
ncbi:MAG: hypothetical protein CTY35_03970 [Methylotenera sp.]|nr:MAG: hypothetical protein CTY35_03970 [Methylotenera sp.]